MRGRTPEDPDNPNPHPELEPDGGAAMDRFNAAKSQVLKVLDFRVEKYRNLIELLQVALGSAEEASDAAPIAGELRASIAGLAQVHVKYDPIPDLEALETELDGWVRSTTGKGRAAISRQWRGVMADLADLRGSGETSIYDTFEGRGQENRITGRSDRGEQRAKGVSSSRGRPRND